MVEIEKKLYSDIKEYCKINGLVIKDFINSLLKKAFTIEKYGETPFGEVSLKPKIQNTEADGCFSNVQLSAIPHRPNNSLSQTEVVEINLQIEDEPKTIFNGDCDIERYKGEVPKSYYAEIKVENIKEAAKKIQKQTEKNSKKRKL